jgi:cyclic pyranopterin phosphate synthase
MAPAPVARPMARMVDISKKPDVPRRAVASGEILLRPATVRAIRAGRVEKGDPIRTAEVAALQAVKRVWEALPHTHPIPITGASAEFTVKRDRVVVTCGVGATYKTGVEMEALYGTTVALLTIWDMVKSLEKDAAGQYPTARIENVRVLAKEKGAARGRRR